MSDFIQMPGAGLLEGAVQALLEGKKYARNLENLVDGILPLVSTKEAQEQLELVRETAMKCGFILQRLYNRNAREAFGLTEGGQVERRHGRQGQTTGGESDSPTRPVNGPVGDSPTPADRGTPAGEVPQGNG